MKPKISIIIPVYNVEKYLCDTMNSIITQSLEDIEIICVDDCSTDNSLKILEAYSKKDSRIKVLKHEENMTASRSRKDGVLSSTGTYIMFLDGDDRLYSDSCQVAYDAIEKYHTDIVHFACEVEAIGDVDDQRIKDTKEAAAPFIGGLSEESLLRSCWIEKKFGIELWSKIYNGELCRKAFQMVENGKFPRAQDLYAFFIISYFAKTYYGISDVLYSYRLGSGISGETYLTVHQFNALVLQKNVLDAIERFTESCQLAGESCIQEVISGLHKRFLNSIVWNWLHHLRPEDKTVTWNMMVDVWGVRDIICNMTRFWNQREFLAEQFACVDEYKIPRRIEKKSGTKLAIGIYYFKMNNGGAERVCVTLANLFANEKDEHGNYKYKVILISDTAANEKDYTLDSKVSREFLVPFDTSVNEKYMERFDGWQEIIARNHLDLVISGLWVAPAVFWDILSVKSHTRCSYIMHQHNFSCIPNKFLIMKPSEVAKDYVLCDGVVVLSKTDQLYVSAYNKNVAFIPNPSEVNPRKEKSLYRKNTIVWVARLSEEKNPLAVLKMMRYVIKTCPNAVLYVIGAGEEAIYNQMIQYINHYELMYNVRMVGFTKDVEKYYKLASVFVCTSDFEGYPLTFGEALSYGVPIITFDMPWLYYIQDGRGIVTVPQGRIDLLAREVISLLQNDKRCKNLGKQSRQLVADISNEKIISRWELILNNNEFYQRKNMAHPDVLLLLRYINEFNKKGGDIQSKDVWIPFGSQQKRIDCLKSELNSLQNSISFKLGRKLTFIPRKIRDILRKSI